MKENKKRKNKGITLIALVITIIVLLILAAVTINLTLGERGIFTIAQQAAKETKLAQEKEEAELDRGQAILSEYNGTAVGKKDSSKNRTLSGKTEETAYTYKNPIIPQGFTAVDDGAAWYYVDEAQTEVKGWNDGLVIEDEEGNQFVWVPVDEEKVKYEMKDWEGSTVALNGTEVTVSLPNGVDSEESQINKYHGFYVARYEAGYEKAENETDKAQGDTAKNNKTDKPLSKYGVKVWNFIEWDQAKASAEMMCNNNNVKSGLITMTQWDTICTWFSNSGLKVDGNRDDWKQYYNLIYRGSGWHAGRDKFLQNWEEGDYNTVDMKDAYITASGLNNGDYHKSIADFTGSLWEWVAGHGGNINYDYYYRGGGISNLSCSDCRKNSGRWCYDQVGFRVTLYLT